MKDETQEHKLVNFAKKTLDRSIQNLDSHTLSRLQSARQTARSANAESLSWGQPAWVVAVAGLVIFTIAVWSTDSPEITTALPFEDVDILASADGWELYEDLEFYSWLAEDDQTG